MAETYLKKKYEWSKVKKYIYVICNIVYEHDPNTEKVLLSVAGKRWGTIRTRVENEYGIYIKGNLYKIILFSMDVNNWSWLTNKHYSSFDCVIVTVNEKTDWPEDGEVWTSVARLRYILRKVMSQDYCQNGLPPKDTA
jgi:hypothetical protein